MTRADVSIEFHFLVENADSTSKDGGKVKIIFAKKKMKQDGEGIGKE
jgi:hypothetical protein